MTARPAHSPAADAANEYKPSIYNHFVEEGDTVWCANFRTRTLIRMDREEYLAARRILAGAGEPCPTSAVEDAVDNVTYNHDDLRKKLIRYHFLVSKDLDELNLLKVKHLATRYGRDKGLTLVIAPTLLCNYACGYCYVDRNAKKMSAEAQERLCRFFERRFPAGATATIAFTGGEPSLALDVVQNLAERFKATCTSKGGTYRSSMITNGYLLNDKMVAVLRASSISELQITLDGSREFHDASRCLPGGSPTYDRILENVEAVCDEFKILLRINVDMRNHHTIPELIDDLVARGLTSRIQPYFAPVDDVNQSTSGYRDLCFRPEQYAKLEAGFVRMAFEKGFSLAGQQTSITPVSTYCGANSANYYVVDSKANLLKCYHGLGREGDWAIGSIGEDGAEIVTETARLVDWLSWDPFAAEECRECVILPLCMGGCSDKIRKHEDRTRGCLRARFTKDELVSTLGNTVCQRRAQKAAASTSVTSIKSAAPAIVDGP